MDVGLKSLKKPKTEDDSPRITSEDIKASDVEEKATCIWKPDPSIPDSDLVSYILAAKAKCNYSMEQALGILMYYKHDLAAAEAALTDFTPYNERWSAEDKVLFEQSFRYHGKNFQLIKQMLPDKSIGALVKYYYSVKKSRHNPNCLDKSLLKNSFDEEDMDDHSDAEDDLPDDLPLKEFTKPILCSNCRSTTHLKQVALHGFLCQNCIDAWKSEGTLPTYIKPEDQSSRLMYTRGMPTGQVDPARPRKVPKGIKLSDDDLRLFTESDGDGGTNLMLQIDNRIKSLQDQTVTNAQLIGELSTRLNSGIDVYRPPDEPRIRPTPKWSENEQMLAVQGFRRYGKNFTTIADVIGTKTESHVRSFYSGFKDRFSLDMLIQEHEDERKKEKSKQTVVIDLEQDVAETSP